MSAKRRLCSFRNAVRGKSSWCPFATEELLGLDFVFSGIVFPGNVVVDAGHNVQPKLFVPLFG